MKARTVVSVLLTLAVALPLTLRAQQDRERGDRDDRDDRGSEHHEHNVNTPVRLIGVIPVPGNPITSADIAWVDPGTERYYLADRSNFGVDIIDAETNFYVGRVNGFVGPVGPNGPGPNGVLVTPNRKLWAGDGNSTVQVADVDPDSPHYLNIIGTISTAMPSCGTPTANVCGRADELGYDPKDHLILIANNAPAKPTSPYATFISAIPPYAVLGHISFPGAGGLEQPLWDPELRRFWITVPGPTGGSPTIARVDPISMMVDKTYTLDCLALTGTASASITGIALAPFQHLLVSACGKPIILGALTGHVFNVITQVGGGDEVWHNPGDDRFYVTGADSSTTPPTLVQSLGVIDAETSTWLQNVPDIRGKNPAAFSENNHIFTVVQINAAIVAAPATDNSTCSQFGLNGRGCIAVFAHDDDR